MKFSNLFGVVALAPASLAHYTFTGLVVNGQQIGRDWEYVREHDNAYMPTKFKNIPEGSIDPLNQDFRCNKGASSGANTKVYTVKPGDNVALKQGFGATSMLHPGPTQVYLSMAPNGDVKTYAGDGDWFKVYQSKICTAGSAATLRDTAWCMWSENTIGFTVPQNIPSGQYLMRVEHIALHGAHDGQAEFYYSCAQLDIRGTNGSSVPGPAVKIPGVYQQDDPAVNFSVWGQSTCYDLTPGPEVISGGENVGSACGNGRKVRSAKRYFGGEIQESVRRLKK